MYNWVEYTAATFVKWVIKSIQMLTVISLLSISPPRALHPVRAKTSLRNRNQELGHSLSKVPCLDVVEELSSAMILFQLS